MALRFDDQFLKKLEYLHVVSKRAFAGHNRADRLTQHRGRGLEFADHRPYTAGDDFRHIDWKAYKRLGRLLLRLFDEERDLPISPMTLYHVWASRSPECWPEVFIGSTPSYLEADQWREQALLDGWAEAWIEERLLLAA